MLYCCRYVRLQYCHIRWLGRLCWGSARGLMMLRYRNYKILWVVISYYRLDGAMQKARQIYRGNSSRYPMRQRIVCCWALRTPDSTGRKCIQMHPQGQLSSALLCKRSARNIGGRDKIGGCVSPQLILGRGRGEYNVRGF
jgi:hypothetical protein